MNNYVAPLPLTWREAGANEVIEAAVLEQVMYSIECMDLHRHQINITRHQTWGEAGADEVIQAAVPEQVIRGLGVIGAAGTRVLLVLLQSQRLAARACRPHLW